MNNIKVNVTDKELETLGKTDLIKVKNEILDNLIFEAEMRLKYLGKGEKLKMNEYIYEYNKEKGIHSFILKYN